MITTRPGGSPRLPSAWPSAPTRWSITATHVWRWQRFWAPPATSPGREPPPSGRSGCTSGKALRHLPRRRAAFSAQRDLPPAPAPPEAPRVELDNACVQAGSRLIDCRQSRGLGRGRAAVRPIRVRRESPEDRRLHADRRPIEPVARGYEALSRDGHGALPPHGSRRARRASCPHAAGDRHCRLSPGAPQDEMLQVVRPRRGRSNRAAGVVRRRRHRRRDRRTRRRARPVRGRAHRPRAPGERGDSRISTRRSAALRGTRLGRHGGTVADDYASVDRPAAW